MAFFRDSGRHIARPAACGLWSVSRVKARYHVVLAGALCRVARAALFGRSACRRSAHVAALTRCESAAPSVSFIAELNAVATAGYSVTVSGVSFGSLDATPSSRVSLTSCVSAAWASASSVVCLLAPGDGPEKDVQVTVEGVVGTRTKLFSYDGEPSRDARLAFFVLRSSFCVLRLPSSHVQCDLRLPERGGLGFCWPAWQ